MHPSGLYRAYRLDGDVNAFGGERTVGDRKRVACRVFCGAWAQRIRRYGGWNSNWF
jgi:hypothetical protein